MFYVCAIQNFDLGGGLEDSNNEHRRRETIVFEVPRAPVIELKATFFTHDVQVLLHS